MLSVLDRGCERSIFWLENGLAHLLHSASLTTFSFCGEGSALLGAFYGEGLRERCGKWRLAWLSVWHCGIVCEVHGVRAINRLGAGRVR